MHSLEPSRVVRFNLLEFIDFSKETVEFVPADAESAIVQLEVFAGLEVENLVTAVFLPLFILEIVEYEM